MMREEKYRQFLWRVLEAARCDTSNTPISAESLALIERLVLDKTGNEIRAMMVTTSLLCAFDVDLLVIMTDLSLALLPFVTLADRVLDKVDEIRHESKKVNQEEKKEGSS